MNRNPSRDYINMICSIYGSTYDDRQEDSAPGGVDWQPGQKALHTSLVAFQLKLVDDYDIKLSTSKIRKILITGNCWTTERSREVIQLYEQYTDSISNGGYGLSKDEAIKAVAEDLGVSTPTVCMNMPYEKVVYGLEDKSSNARRCDQWRERKKYTDNWKRELWQAVIDLEGKSLRTSGRGNRPGVEFSFEISRKGSAGGRHYSGDSIDGYGNELWVIDSSDERRKKSISRSTVELGYTKYTQLMKEKGKVPGPKSLGIPGVGSYLYPILAIVCSPDSGSDVMDVME